MDPISAKGHNGTVTFDGVFVTITRKGFLARATVGKGEKRIPLASITAVQWKPPGAIVNGYIQFTIGGGSERRAQFGRQTTDAASDENSVVVTKAQKAPFEALRTAVDDALEVRYAPTAPAVATGPTALDQLKQLADLRDAGIVTPAEFDAKKAQLLGLTPAAPDRIEPAADQVIEVAPPGPSAVPSGWHPDPRGDMTLLRYWDGNAWTEHTHPSAS